MSCSFSTPDAIEIGEIKLIDLLNEMDFYELHVLSKDGAGNTMLHIFSKHGEDEMVDIVIKNGGNVHAVNEDKQTPLHLAFEAGNLEVIKILLANGAVLKATDKNGETPIFLAAKHGHCDLINFFANSNNHEVFSHINSDGESVLHVATRVGNIEIVRLLLKVTIIDVNLSNCINHTPLWIAVESGFFDVVQCLLAKGADVTATDGRKRSLLQLALQREQFKIAGELIASGVNVNHKDSTGSTALHTAAETKSNEVLTFMLNKTVDVNLVDEDGYSVLHLVAEFPELHSSNLKTLIGKGAKIHQQTFNGDSALHRAAAVGNIFAATVLMHASCDLINMKNHSGSTPLQLAKENGHSKIASDLDKFVHRCPVKTIPKRKSTTIKRLTIH